MTRGQRVFGASAWSTVDVLGRHCVELMPRGRNSRACVNSSSVCPLTRCTMMPSSAAFAPRIPFSQAFIALFNPSTGGAIT